MKVNFILINVCLKHLIRKSLFRLEIILLQGILDPKTGSNGEKPHLILSYIRISE